MDDRQKELARYRLYRAELELETAKEAFRTGNYFRTLSSSYYAMFHAARALCALKAFDSKKHSGIIGYFNKHFVATGQFDSRYSQFLYSAFDVRHDSDYGDFYIARPEDAETQINNANEFVFAVKRYLDLAESK